MNKKETEAQARKVYEEADAQAREAYFEAADQIWKLFKEMTIIKTSYVDSVNPELDDQELPAILYNALGITFYEFVERTLDKVDKAINGRRGKSLYVRCFRTKKRKCGWCFKTGGGLMPDIVLGFCGDIKDLEITLIHELLHLFRWDEKMVEAKAREIYKNGRNSI